MEQFSKNFSYEELIASTTADRLGLKNIPNDTEKEKLRQLVIKILQPIRDAWGSSITINSAFRSEKVNKAVGGVPTSQHRLGEAADITLGSKENWKLYNLIRDMVNKGIITVGQCIWEYGDNKNPQWVHVSLPTAKHKNEFFKIK